MAQLLISLCEVVLKLLSPCLVELLVSLVQLDNLLLEFFVDLLECANLVIQLFGLCLQVILSLLQSLVQVFYLLEVFGLPRVFCLRRGFLSWEVARLFSSSLVLLRYALVLRRDSISVLARRLKDHFWFSAASLAPVQDGIVSEAVGHLPPGWKLKFFQVEQSAYELDLLFDIRASGGLAVLQIVEPLKEVVELSEVFVRRAARLLGGEIPCARLVAVPGVNRMGLVNDLNVDK